MSEIEIIKFIFADKITANHKIVEFMNHKPPNSPATHRTKPLTPEVLCIQQKPGSVAAFMRRTLTLSPSATQ
jgi:hypothetical protein